MNKDWLSYKFRFITVMLVLSYTYLHLKLTGQYVNASLDQLFHFSAQLPFGQRLLVPILARLLSLFLPLPMFQLFFLIELVINALCYLVLIRLFEREFTAFQAQVLVWLLFLLLPLLTVINYRFSIQGEVPIFYPYDSASLLFMAAGFLFCLRGQWIYFISTLFLATFNRETSILLILMIPALHWRSLRKLFLPIIVSVCVYVLARIIIFFIVRELPGHLIELYFRYPDISYYQLNLFWLLQDKNILLFIFCFAGLPLFWFAFFDYIPIQYKPLRYVVLFHFICLLFVGRLVEGRLYLDTLVLMYLPVCVAIKDYLLEETPLIVKERSGFFYFDRYAVLGILVSLVLFGRIINSGIIYLGNHYY